MLAKEKSERNTLEIVNIEELVPLYHLRRKIDSAVDFTHVYDFVEDLYSLDNGWPASTRLSCLKWPSSNSFVGSRPSEGPWKRSA